LGIGGGAGLWKLSALTGAGGGLFTFKRLSLFFLCVAHNTYTHKYVLYTHNITTRYSSMYIHTPYKQSKQTHKHTHNTSHHITSHHITSHHTHTNHIRIRPIDRRWTMSPFHLSWSTWHTVSSNKRRTRSISTTMIHIMITITRHLYHNSTIH